MFLSTHVDIVKKQKVKEVKRNINHANVVLKLLHVLSMGVDS